MNRWGSFGACLLGALLAFVAFAGSLSAFDGAGLSGALAAERTIGASADLIALQQTPPDTLMTRADSIRARLLERVRRSDPVPPDSVQGGEPDSIRPPGAAVTTGEPAGADAQAAGASGRTGPMAELPSGADSIMRGLARLPGYTIATYSGARVDFLGIDRRLTLIGLPDRPARFSGEGVRVEADSSIVYDEEAGRVRTFGQTLLTSGQDEPLSTSSLVYDVPSRRATAFDAETTYDEGQGSWIVRGNLDSVQDGLVWGSNTIFTSCDHDPPHSHFEAEAMKIIAERVLVARSVRLYFDNVPVAWLPFLAQPMSSGRSSGILTPRFSVNDIVRTSEGYNRRISNVGFYWAMSEYSDASLAMDWWSNQYTALTGSLRYRWARQFLQGDVSLRRFWRESGARDFAVSTRNNWEVGERTRVSLSGNYVTNTGLVRQTSLDPRELTSSIDSNAGIQHRFGWGNLSLSARRQQYLSDDRLEMTLPNASLSMNTLTLFGAPPQRSSWYNNLSLSGSTSFSRDLREFPVQPDTIFRLNRADNTRTQARIRGSAGLGSLNLSSQMNYRETVFPEIPAEFFEGGAQGMTVLPMRLGPGAHGPAVVMQESGPGETVSFSDATADWSVSLGYQQRLMGNSTLTPSLSFSGNMARVDSIPDAASFVSAPSRLSLGMNLRTEVFGFYPGFASFEAIRHKLSPGLSYSYSPATEPTALQEQVFGSRNLRVQNQLSLSVNQTFEARVEEEEPEADPGAATEAGGDPEPGDPDPDAPELADPDADDPEPPLLTEEIDDELEGPEPGTDDLPADEDSQGDEPRRAPQSRVVTLLGLNTSAIAYDLVQADSTGRFLDGFTTTRITNTVRSDFLRGLSLSFAHSLFEEPAPGEEGSIRRFAPHLEQLSLGFSVDNQTGLVQAVAGLLGIEPSADGGGGPTGPGQPGAPEGAESGFEGDDPFGNTGGFDENRVIPGESGDPGQTGPRRQGWDARFSYSLRRPRSPSGTQSATGPLRTQMLSATLSFQPTVNWDATWQTTYDIEENRFNDHILRLSRDLHEWEASFGFRQTANGNWSFQFDVSLKANRDLHFDYEQRNVDGRLGSPGERLPGGF